MNGVMIFAKYFFITIAALILEYILLAIYNGIAAQYAFPTLISWLLIISMPVTVVIFIWIGWREMTDDTSSFENGNAY